MKFNMLANYYLVSLSFKFHEDWCINARAQVVNAGTYVLSRVSPGCIMIKIVISPFTDKNLRLLVPSGLRTPPALSTEFLLLLFPELSYRIGNLFGMPECFSEPFLTSLHPISRTSAFIPTQSYKELGILTLVDTSLI